MFKTVRRASEKATTARAASLRKQIKTVKRMAASRATALET
jgi:hypothetical protein